MWPSPIALSISCDLERMSGWEFRRIPADDGAPGVIEFGGYDRRFIDDTRRYVEKLLRCKQEPELVRQIFGHSLRKPSAQVPPPIPACTRSLVHRRNVEAVTAS